ncbi:MULTISPECIES: hypothetical protein [unclassified Butyrivibrio]|jgi:hypothetical protein|uniref:hypothetical protein n=1 Tax=unclassified Butyrivibrio TaxID=2639466 RepID=UPI0004141DAF|nr:MULTISPECIES: hypothetical protein [unclassified Butyrivibrio]
MAEQVITKDMLDYTVDSLIAMTVEELSSKLDMPENDILADFLQSKTCKLLYDTDLKIWWEGPVYLSQMYMEEKGIEIKD